MLIWRGFGFLTPLLLMLPFLGCVMAGLMLIGALPERFAAIPFFLSVPLGLVVGGVVCWMVGNKLNQGRPNEMAHTTWFVRIEHWGIVSLVLAVPVGALCLLIVGVILQFSGGERPDSDPLAGVAGEQGPIEIPTPPFDLSRPEPTARLLAEFENVEDLDPIELIMAARMAINEQKPELAAELQRVAVEKGLDQYYNLACYESLAGNLDASIYWLQEAGLKEGVNVDWSQQDSDLVNVRADRRWKRVLAFLKQCSR
jgi:hypothetical protein